MRQGASHASARHSARMEERIHSRNEALHTQTRDEAGLCVRAFVSGAEGAAATTELTREAALACAREAVAAARATAMLSPGPATLPRGRPGPARHAPPVLRDPFTMPLGEKLAFVAAATKAQLADAVGVASVLLRFLREDALIVTSEGGAHERSLCWTGAGVRVVASGGGRIEVRTAPARSGGVWLGGFEVLERLDLTALGARCAAEAVALLKAPPCPQGVRDVVLDPWLAARLVHETLARPLCGNEPSFIDAAGGLGKARVGSAAVTLLQDPRVVGLAGTFGVDDEGFAPRPLTLVHGGLALRRLLARADAGRRQTTPTGSARAASFRDVPRARPCNLVLSPGGGDLDALLAGVADGVYLEGARAFTSDAAGATFRIAADVAWEVKAGKRTRLLRGGALGGRTAEVWRTCDAVGGLEAAALAGFWGDDGPSRFPLPVGHRTPPVRLRKALVLPVGT